MLDHEAGLMVIQRIRRRADTWVRHLRGRQAGLRHGISVGPGVQVGPRTRLVSEQGGRICIGAGSYVEEGVVLVATGPGSLYIGKGVFIGHHSTLVAKQELVVGDGAALAEMVSVRDHDHVLGCSPGTGGLAVAPVHIGADCWVAAKASILKGVTLGPHAVVGAHAVVRHDVPARGLAVGIPAKIIRIIEER